MSRAVILLPLYAFMARTRNTIISFYSEKCSHNVKALLLYFNVYMWHTLSVPVLPTFLAAASDSKTPKWQETHLFQMTSQLHRWLVGQHTVTI